MIYYVTYYVICYNLLHNKQDINLTENIIKNLPNMILFDNLKQMFALKLFNSSNVTSFLHQIL